MIIDIHPHIISDDTVKYPITPLGNDLETTWKRLLAGESGIGPITLFDATDYDSRVAGEVKDFVAEDFIPAKQARRMDRFTQFAVVAAQQLLKDSGLVINDDNASLQEALRIINDEERYNKVINN